jgi:hypothetical protein
MHRRATRRKAPPALETLPQAADEVWEGGAARLSSPIQEEEDEEPFHPEVALWVASGDGFALGHELALPGEGETVLLGLLPEVMRKPMVGRPRRPATIRVRDAETAARLQSEYASLGITIETSEQLPDWQAVIDVMDRTVNPDQGYEPASPEHAAALAELFRAAAAFYRAAPWQIVEDSQPLSIEPVGAPQQAVGVTILGTAGEQRGLVIFPSVAVMLEFYQSVADDDPIDVELADFPPSLALNFAEAEELLEEDLEVIRTQGWEVAAPDAYPLLLATDPGEGGFLDLSLEPVLMMTMTLRAATHFWTEAEPNLRAGDLPIIRELDVPFADGIIPFRIACPPLLPEPSRRTRRPAQRRQRRPPPQGKD